MMKKTGYLVLLIFCINMQAQQAVSKGISLQNRLSSKVLDAYNNNFEGKANDFYNYCELLTNSTLTPEAKKEIVLSIEQLFDNQNPIIVDFTAAGHQSILLLDLLQKLKTSKPMHFSVTHQNEYSGIFAEGWLMKYRVKTTIDGQEIETPINQQVFLIETEKTFGTVIRKVWKSYFGAMH